MQECTSVFSAGLQSAADEYATKLENEHWTAVSVIVTIEKNILLI